MPLIKSVSVTVGGTKNLGDYNNARIEVSLGGDLLDGEDPEGAIAYLCGLAREKVREQLQDILQKSRQEKRL